MIDLTCRDFKLIRRALRGYIESLQEQCRPELQINEVEKILKVLEAYKQ
jgi:hypothetical protein